MQPPLKRLSTGTGQQEGQRMQDVDENFGRVEQAIDTLNANASLQQAGSITLQLTSGAGSGTVTFPTEYPTKPPYIVLTPAVDTLGNKFVYGIKNVTKTGFDIVCERDTDYTTVTFHWIAMPR
jgi:hypothetical protein